MKYLIDANILISGYKVHYPLDVHVSYWKIIASQIANGTFVIIDKVKDEVQDEPIVEWLKQNIDKKLYQTSVDSLAQYKYLQNWAAKVTSSALRKKHTLLKIMWQIHFW